MKNNFKIGFFMSIETGQDESAFDNVDVDDMLQNVITGMLRQYDLKQVTIKQRNSDPIIYTQEGTVQ